VTGSRVWVGHEAAAQGRNDEGESFGHDCRRLKTRRSAHSEPVGTTGPLVAPLLAGADSASACHDLVPATGILVAVGISSVLWVVVGLALFLVL
jgi:hypothetical protein